MGWEEYIPGEKGGSKHELHPVLMEEVTVMGSGLGGLEPLQAKPSACLCTGNQKASAVDTEFTATVFKALSSGLLREC